VRGGAGGEILASPLPSLGTTVVKSWLRRGVLSSWAWWQAPELAYQVWKARQVADQQGSGAVAVEGGQQGEARKALVDFVVLRLKGDLFPALMEMMV
jgi:hypothetical protein